MSGLPSPFVYPPVCPTCQGDGQTGMERDGQPVVCRTCDGNGHG